MVQQFLEAQHIPASFGSGDDQDEKNKREVNVEVLVGLLYRVRLSRWVSLQSCWAERPY